MKWFIFTLAVAWMLVGCSTRDVYIDRPVEVKIPVKCEVPLPLRPQLDAGPKGVQDLAIYADTLECVAKQCRGEVCKD